MIPNPIDSNTPFQLNLMNLHLTRFTNHAFLRIEGKIHANKQDSGEQIVFHIQNTPQFTSFQSITHQAQSSILKKDTREKE